MDKSWQQIERLIGAGVVLRESFQAMENIVNVQDKQGEQISLDEVLRPRPVRQSAVRLRATAAAAAEE